MKALSLLQPDAWYLNRGLKMSSKPQFLSSIEVPDGEYAGLWSGYEIKFQVSGREVFITTRNTGVRGINIPVVFRVANGQLDEGSIKVRS